MNSESSPHKSWIERLSNVLLREPQDREQLIHLLHDAKERELLDEEALDMIEGVLHVSEIKAREIMVPKTQMVCIEEDATLADALPIIIDSGHSRFPVLNEPGDRVLGVLLAKDLLKIIQHGTEKTFKLNKLVRKAAVIPESMRLDMLLKEFRQSHNHLAIVIDEYGIIAGLVTIEDVLEQIVGNIEDEYDTTNNSNITEKHDNEYLVKALTPLEEFNDYFKCEYQNFDTIGGLLLSKFTHIPKIGEHIELDDFKFTITQAGNRRIKQFRIHIKHKGK